MRSVFVECSRTRGSSKWPVHDSRSVQGNWMTEPTDKSHYYNITSLLRITLPNYNPLQSHKLRRNLLKL